MASSARTNCKSSSTTSSNTILAPVVPADLKVVGLAVVPAEVAREVVQAAHRMDPAAVVAPAKVANGPNGQSALNDGCCVTLGVRVVFSDCSHSFFLLALFFLRSRQRHR